MARLSVIDLQGKEVRDLDLPDEVFGSPLKDHLIYEAVLAYRAAGRRGTHATKNRSDVRGGGKKPWRQKKTGRSRHGSIRSPIWKGGGTVFGPQPHTYDFAFPRRKRHGALRSALSAKLRDGKLLVVDSLTLSEPRTKELAKVMQGLGVKGSALLVDEPGNRHLELSARNLPRVKATLSTALNIVDVLEYDTVVLTEAAAGRVAEVLKP
ncbi:MAG: 50S ribosomal protein L4 [Candidatus Rokubacteria bacterium RIFCSPLOWO2_02_FULL_71_18]|nr:MAG: 50S ribosomal protein L4 [Candidatus Rokubacteria bacterium RIFCSPLOWO2_02_FULL_71_18]